MHLHEKIDRTWELAWNKAVGRTDPGVLFLVFNQVRDRIWVRIDDRILSQPSAGRELVENKINA